jgi:class 3 adenylate cyclase/tetratricopeptide (TPR) repeat protein
MVKPAQSQIEKLRLSIKGLEAQRGVLGDEVINPALAALRQQLAVLEQQSQLQAAPIEERRLVTILFFDIVGSTSLAEKLDPEEWRQVVSRVHSSLGEAIISHHGSVAQYLGDGMLAFFGSQKASEHDPENSIRAALDGHASVTAVSLPHKIQLRAGIHTGLVVVGELGNAIHKEFTASGDAVNLAARLQSAAPPGGTLISHDTYRYVRGVFNLTPQPPLTVKGKSEPLQSYLVRSAKPRPFRSVARGVAGVETRTIGRELEMQALQAAYLRAYEGHNLVWAQLVSEPGLGKSRLMADLTDWIDLRPETTWLLRARAFPDDANQPFALVRRLWFDRFQIAEDAPLYRVEAKWVERFKEAYGQENTDEAAHALGLLVGLSFINSPYIKGMRDDPNQVKGRAFVVSQELIKAVRQQNPIVVFLEDLQWTEPASWEYLMQGFLAGLENKQPNGLFILGAARPEWQPPKELSNLFTPSIDSDQILPQWGSLINLAPLSDQSTRILAQELLLRAVDVPEHVIDLLVERSEGVPYFTEEMVNWFIDHHILDTRSDPWRFLPERLKEEPLPSTLQHLLLTRLSVLSQPERAALQRGAIFGRRFWTGGVEALGVSAGDEVLGHLQPRGFVEAQPESAFQGDTEWSFHQSLLQEVTYESVLKRERASLHKVAAGWLEQQARQASRLDEFAGLLGDHYERAGELGIAVDWYLRAGKRAMAQGAPREASDFYTRALDLLPPIDRERRWQTLLGREVALGILGDAEPWRADINALIELAQNLEDDNCLAEAYLRQAMFASRTGDLSLSGQASREALAAAKRCGYEAIEIKALAQSAVVGILKGDRSIILQNNIEEALQRARGLGDDNVLSFVLYRAYFYYGEFEIVRSYSLASEQAELEHRLGNRLEEATCLGNIGAGCIWLGLYKQGRVLLDQVIQIHQSFNGHRSLAYDYSTLAEMYLATGDIHNAHRLAQKALQEIIPSQDTRGKAGILDVLGNILLAMGDSISASRMFSEAYDLAMSEGLIAKACETKSGLAASCLVQGQLEEAHKYALEAWKHLQENGSMGLDRPGKVYLMCAETLDALGDSDNAKAVIEHGYRDLMDFVSPLQSAEWRHSLLENVPYNRALIQLWERNRL